MMLRTHFSRRTLPLLGLAGLALFAPPAQADSAKPFLHSLFTDNMVLQRGLADPVWGWTTPGQVVTVRLTGKDGKARTAKAVADAGGKWTAHLPVLQAGPGGPYTLTASAAGKTETRGNILIGDVWICSGQSNMEFGIGNTDNSAAEIAAANYPTLRLFKLGHDIAVTPQTVPNGGAWVICTPDTVKQGGWNGFSAVGYFFGRDLQRKINVPIGLIETDWGGTPAQAWTSAAALETMPDFRPALEAQRQALTAEGGYPAKMAAWYARNDKGSVSDENGNTWASAALTFRSTDWPTMTLPQNWEGAGIPALANFDGVVWYRKAFMLTAAQAKAPLTLHLGPIDDRDTTSVNGVVVGGLDDYTVSRDYSVPASALRAGHNVIAVRVLDTGGGGGIYGKPEQMFVEAGGDKIPLAGDWAYKIGGPLPAGDLPPIQGGDQNQPTVLYNGMVAPLVSYGIKGAIWYQGESNAGNAKQYQTLLPTLINDWRGRWGQGDFPFLIVQLANFGGNPDQPGQSNWAELREAQSMTATTLPKTGLAVAVDVGNPKDIHPTNKQEVGRRLALVAETVACGLPGESSGPVFTSMKIGPSVVRLDFAHTTGGLVAKGGPLTGFAVAGADGKFVRADAKIDADSSVMVSSPAVPNPTDVRYGWADSPVCNLYNGFGLPASPFRTGK